MTVFVERDAGGLVVVIYANRQEGYAEEELSDDHSDVVAFFNPPVDLPAYTAQKRWEKEVGGITVGGLPIHTDDRSKMMITGARVAATADPNFTTEWKAADGSFVTIDAATVIAVSDAVLAHVAACFAIEAQVLAQIVDGTITTTAEVDAAFA